MPSESVGVMSLSEDVMEALAVDVFAEALFNAYNEAGPNPWKTWDGKDVPRWDAVTEQVREKWRAACREAARITDADGEPFHDQLAKRVLEVAGG